MFCKAESCWNGLGWERKLDCNQESEHSYASISDHLPKGISGEKDLESCNSSLLLLSLFLIRNEYFVVFGFVFFLLLGPEFDARSHPNPS